MSSIQEQAQDPSIFKILAGAAGAFVSLKFIQGTWKERTVMAIGGCALSAFGTTPAATWVGLANAEGLVGFLIGLFGMSIVAKLYEVIQAIQPPLLLEKFFNWVFPNRNQ